MIHVVGGSHIGMPPPLCARCHMKNSHPSLGQGLGVRRVERGVINPFRGIHKTRHPFIARDGTASLSGEGGAQEGSESTGTSEDEHSTSAVQKKTSSSLTKRALFGSILGVAAAVIIVIGGWPFAAVTCLLAYQCSQEFVGLVNAKGISKGMIPPPPLVSSAISLMCVSLCAWSFMSGGKMASAMAVASFLVLSLQLVAVEKPRFAQLTSSVFGLLYCGYLPSFWIKLRLLAIPASNSYLLQSWQGVMGGVTHATVGLVATFTAVACIIAADTGAYFCGKSLGKTQLISVSPKKTVEGAIGGLLSSILVAVSCYRFLGWPDSTIGAVALGVIVFISSIFGDLIESVIKRDAGLKDASNLIPGHGGLLDRLDSYLFTGACVYFFMRFFLGRPMYTPTRTSSRTTSRLVQCNADSGGLSYKSAGVDIEAGNELVKRIQKLNPSIGGFSGMVPFGDSFLVAGTDGVGTKLKLAFDLNKHDTVGIDLVAMSVNDIITSGAKPMFFLDYFATGKLDVDTAEQVVKGIVDGCNESECQLLGGETAEMPGFYADGEYDLAGFAVGSVLKSKVIDGSRIQAGDVILGYKSSGVHSNGFSLVRKVIETSGSNFNQSVEWSDQSLGLNLLTPTRLYVKDVMSLIDMVDVKGLVHITGGGFPENIPRVIPKGLGTRIFNNSWDIPPLFKWIQENGKIVDSEMFLTFNMGIGMIAVVSPSDAEKALSLGVDATIIGEIVEGGGVDIV